MDKTDFKKEYKNLFQPPQNKVLTVNVPAMNFIMVDGEGDPNTSEHFRNAVEALYTVAYSIKFALKRTKTVTINDYVVPPLEGLWWCDDMNNFSLDNKDEWKWTLMIMQPDFVSIEIFKDTLSEVSKKKDLNLLSILRFERFIEGHSAQIMHIGPFSNEAATVEKLHKFINDNGFIIAGKHHEIYLSDPRKADPMKMKTIIRQPYRAE